MIHYNLETVMKEAEDTFERMNMGKMPDTLGKCAFVLGILKSRYERMFNDLPEKFKSVDKNTLDKMYANVWGGQKT